jgi:hypothetical protein
MDKYLDELFAPPIGLDPAYNIDGITFYSSNKLKEKFILAFEKSSKGKHIIPEIQKLVKKDIIIPCYKSKNILSFIKHKLTKGAHKFIMAFYAVEDKKVIVIIDNSATVFGSSSNNEITSTTMHECMHLIAGRNLSKFVQIFLPKLRAYYSEFFKDYLKLKSKEPKKVDEFIKYMVQFERRGPMYANKNLANLYRLIESLFISNSHLNNQEFQIRLTNLIVAAKLFIVSMPSLMKNARRFSMVFTSLNQAYQKAFGEKNTYTTPIQEMVSLSEVACVLAEMKPKDSSIKKLSQIIA